MSPDANKPSTGVPEGYLAIAVTAAQADVPLQIRVLARLKADPSAGHLVVLRDTVDAQVLLGCITDSQGLVHQWAELWVQNLANLAGTPPACREALSNAVLDDRWLRQYQLLREMDGSAVFHTGWEGRHPLPTYLDLSAGKAVHPADGSGRAWELCQDAALLARKGVADYGTTLHRYLHIPALGDQSPLVPVTADAPAGAGTIPPAQAYGASAGLVPFNPQAGLMMVRAYTPVDFEGFVEVLGGANWEGVLHGRAALNLGHLCEALQSTDTQSVLADEGRLFLGRHGRHGRLVETFHLELRLLLEAVEAVAAALQRLERPLLNLTADSLRVVLDPPGRGLPFLWTARPVLADAGNAITLPIRASDARYFLPARSGAVSVYRPAAASLTVGGRASVRFRQVLPEQGGITVLEGTVATQERLAPGRNDLVWLRLNLACGRVDLYARLESEKALASGEGRFRTIGQRFTEAQVSALKASEGVPFHDSPFELVPLLSSPCDLYSLGVLAVRTLLVSPRTTLPAALDELLSLARQVAVEHDASAALGPRIKKIFDGDNRWVESLGPQHLVHEEMTSQEAFDLIPPSLWWDTLGAVIRMFPGIGPDSICRDFSDAPAGGIHKTLDPARCDLEKLVLRSRSLVVIDWRFNREIHSVIRGFLTAQGGSVSPGA